ncbi:MAG: hypothetical protein LC679_18130 [Intrasporangiaceae bacterium]|nr:hypothetical protein [Intrasporangiaceae bacterium]
MVRSLLWLVAGLVAFALVIVISAPELAFRDLTGTAQLALLAGIAGVPGLLVLLTIAIRRRMRNDPGPNPDAGRDPRAPAAGRIDDTDQIDQEH